MQFSQFRALRGLLYSTRPTLIPSRFHRNFPHKTTFTATHHRLFSEYSYTGAADDNPPVNKTRTVVPTVYDPVTGSSITKPNAKPDENPNPTRVLSASRSSEYQNDLKIDRSYGSVGKPNHPTAFGSGRKKGTTRSKSSWVCSECGYSDGQWWEVCRNCRSPQTMVEFSGVEPPGSSGGKTTGFGVSEKIVRGWLPSESVGAQPLRLTDVNQRVDDLDWKIPLSGQFGNEVATVLGGGIVPGSLVLIGGDPGVGKSTLLLQIAAIIAKGHGMGKAAPVLYVSGEESVEQIGNRARRMEIDVEEVFAYSNTDMEDILKKAQSISPRAIAIDSIQTVYLNGVTGSAGSIYQVKECTSALLRFAKTTNIPVFLIGHVTKSGDIAGPRVLEHIVDTVLHMEGEQYSSYRLLRSLKNRFGSTDELGVFEMSQSGLKAVLNPSEICLSQEHSDSEFKVGLAVAAIMDGSRTFLIGIQALCARASISRQVKGVRPGKADMITSILIKQAGLKLQSYAVSINVVSGVDLKETAGDLAIAAAICSSFLESPIPNGVAFIGEIGLGGELRMVPRMDKRVKTVAKLGYLKCIVPKQAEKSLSSLDFGEMRILGCKNLKEMINAIFWNVHIV